LKIPIAHFLAALIPLASLRAEEARRLDAAELDASFSKAATPLKRAGGGILGARAGRKIGQTSGSAAPTEAQRTYSRDARIITYSDGQKSEAPYARVPLLFVKGKAELLPDANTSANVALLADKVRQYGAEGGRFVIEGHASAEGDVAVNQRLSKARADAIYEQLIQQHGVPQSYLLRAEGRGSRDAHAPATASERELEQDRKVLVVKEQ
jgi:outer membrane protein OmpA-like peptidoglycan-associated protein